MSLKSFYLFLMVGSLIRKTITACNRMQRWVNRSHTSLTKSPVKRPGLDH